MDDPINTEYIRNPDGTFKEGTPGGPGRNKGQTLKEYWRTRFAAMTDEEKIAFTAKVGNEVIWKMAEGNPKQDTDVTTNGESITPLLVRFLDDKPSNGNTEGV